MPRCPLCGGRLDPVPGHYLSAPWRCPACFRGWFAAELTPEAQASYRRAQDDFRPRGPVAEAVRLELEQAALRHASLRPEQVPLVEPVTLRRLLGTVSDDLAVRIRQHLGEAQ